MLLYHPRCHVYAFHRVDHTTFKIILKKSNAYLYIFICLSGVLTFKRLGESRHSRKTEIILFKVCCKTAVGIIMSFQIDSVAV